MKRFIIQNIILKSIVVIFLTAMLFACKNDIKKVNSYNDNDSLPVISAFDFEYIFSDSGYVRAKLTSPFMEKYEGDTPYTIFPKGFKIVFFNSFNQIESELFAEHGINYEKDKLLIATKNVVVNNIKKSEKLESQELNWDQRKKIIYSDTAVKITTLNDVLYGDGLTSDEKFDRYEIINSRGKVEVEEEDENKR